MAVNDNEIDAARPGSPAPDVHGQAAMLLVESLIHGLVARSHITVAEAIDIVEVAADVKAEMGPDAGDTPATLAKSLALLEAIRHSLSHDV